MSEKMPGNTSFEKIPAEITWTDIDYIVSNGIGLRSVSNEDQARSELVNGTLHGDALALYNIDAKDPEVITQNQERYTRYKTKPPMPKNEETLIWYRNAIKHFIAKALNAFDTKDTPTTFFLVKVGNPRAYDIELYGGLGKAGDQQFTPDAYLTSFTIEPTAAEDEDVSELALKHFLKKLKELQAGS